jgi:hypothetical protein
MSSQASRLLKGHDSLFRYGAELAVSCGPRVQVASDGEPPLKVPYRVTAGAGPQDEGLRNSSNSCNSWPLPFAPTIRLRNSPSWNTSSVGMLMTLKRMAISP